MVFPLIQLPRKSEAYLRLYGRDRHECEKFPLIQLPRKSEVLDLEALVKEAEKVSINSTSEEVRRV